VWQTEDKAYGAAQCASSVAHGTGGQRLNGHRLCPSLERHRFAAGPRPRLPSARTQARRHLRVRAMPASPTVELTGSDSWGGQIATDLPPGEHTVSCRNERSPEAPDDAGARFRISATLSR
jgi:hypothetical protein